MSGSGGAGGKGREMLSGFLANARSQATGLLAAAADKVKPVDKGKGETVAKDVGFKPVRSPLDEHTTSLAGALLNKSKSKGSAKFKGAAGGDGGSDGGAESRSTKFLGV